MKRPCISIFFLLTLLVSCTPSDKTSPESVTSNTLITSEITDVILHTPPMEATASQVKTLAPTLGLNDWMDLPVVPLAASEQMYEVYQRGVAVGRAADRFSKLGDCQSVPTYFLSTFDEGTYRLGAEYSSLQTTIEHFRGSWSRNSLAVKGGLNVAAVQTLYYTDPDNCQSTESPMVCELRVNNPSIVLISFETWWAGKPTSGFEERLRSVVEYVLSQDIVPILATKADNLEGDNSINAAIARIAFEYDVPLWNFWAAANPLPSYGLSDGFHLTFAQNIFDDPDRMLTAWPWRNLTALQTIDAVYRSLSKLP